MIEQQLQLAQARLLGPGPIEAGLAQGGTGDGERVDRIRLAAGAATPTRRSGQPWRHPHERLAGVEQQPLQAAAEVATVLERPGRSPASERAQLNSPSSSGPLQPASSRPSSSTATAVSSCLCTSTPITIIDIAF